jgi:hypothetical protein
MNVNSASGKSKWKAGDIYTDSFIKVSVFGENDSRAVRRDAIYIVYVSIIGVFPHCLCNVCMCKFISFRGIRRVSDDK